jgi:hypothetical protein
MCFLIIGALAVAFGGSNTLRLWGRTDLTAIGLLYTVPILLFGVFVCLAYIFYPRLRQRFSEGALIGLSFGLTFLLLFLLLVWALAA